MHAVQATAVPIHENGKHTFPVIRVWKEDIDLNKPFPLTVLFTNCIETFDGYNYYGIILSGAGSKRNGKTESGWVSPWESHWLPAQCVLCIQE